MVKGYIAKKKAVLSAAALALVLGVEPHLNLSDPLSPFLSFKNHNIVQGLPDLNKEKEDQLRKELEGYLSENKIGDLSEAIHYSLDFVAKNLTFRMNYFLGETGSNYYTFPEGEKTTDCRDYAFLFSRTLNLVCSRVSIENIETEVMRSKDALLFGKRIDNHDWVRVKNTKTGETRYIDPTFYDMHLPCDLEPLLD